MTHSNTPPEIDIYFGDNLDVLAALPDASFDLIYIDPPFNTGRTQTRTQLKTIRDDQNGDRTGFKGQRYRTVRLGSKAFLDTFTDFTAFLEPRLEHARRLLRSSGSFFLHIDYREVHYCKVLLDTSFGRSSFMNEIIWAYDYGARAKRRWSPKHDNILWYAKDPENYTYRYEDIDRIPYMAPGLVGPEKAAKGKTPTDTWWHTIVSPNGKEKTGYPTQKPIGIINRIVRVHSNPGDLILDFFAGSGTIGESALRHGRSVVLVDNNPEAIAVMKRRFAAYSPVRHHDCDEIAVAKGTSRTTICSSAQESARRILMPDPITPEELCEIRDYIDDRKRHGSAAPWIPRMEHLIAEVERLQEGLAAICDSTNHGARDDGSCEEDGGECVICSVLDCPYNDPLHYHHDGCPSEWAEEEKRKRDLAPEA